MREIKFRAWDKDLKKWLGWETVSQCAIGEFVDDVRFELVQYTGLKDKNGVEIYGGDIFRDNSINQIYKVIWFKEGFRVEVDGMILSFDETLTDGKCEVIGNVWENPELLERDA
ncbi:YopX family protein [Alkalicoccus luteus]|uniref:YopX protein domain-containing protein n=1 Tax=Alkalicoccus luteus TaxID=1237094 RepID=A0A969TT18_9BACI|nr:YopX family protein [Alkalicoccus luteus]NJP37178.1 hypothetical protein [Alkalicoccus luteus]